AHRDHKRRQAERDAAGSEPLVRVPELIGFADRIRELPERQRVAVVLRFVADLTEPDIAQIMGVRRGTVSATLRAALRTLEPGARPARPAAPAPPPATGPCSLAVHHV